MWKCPKCDEEIAETFDLCWNCLSDREGTVVPYKADLSDIESLENIEEMQCPVCKRSMQSGFVELIGGRGGCSLRWTDTYPYDLLDKLLNWLLKKKTVFPENIETIIEGGLLTTKRDSLRKSWRCNTCKIFCFRD